MFQASAITLDASTWQQKEGSSLHLALSAEIGTDACMPEKV